MGVPCSAKVVGRICRRVSAGETVLAICRDADMPSRGTFHAWVREHPKVRALYERAKLYGGRTGRGRPARYCPVTAHEIAVRVAEGEALSDIVEDPAMPSISTVYRWETREAEFAEALAAARWAQAERLADLGWKMALAATPQTAHLTRVQLGQLRWAAGIKAPRTHGRLKAAEPPQAPEAPKVMLFRRFEVEENYATGQHRVVSYRAAPDAMRPVRDHVGPWTTPVAPLRGPSPEHQADRLRLARQRAVEQGLDPAEIGLGPEDDGSDGGRTP